MDSAWWPCLIRLMNRLHGPEQALDQVRVLKTHLCRCHMTDRLMTHGPIRVCPTTQVTHPINKFCGRTTCCCTVGTALQISLLQECDTSKFEAHHRSNKAAYQLTSRSPEAQDAEMGRHVARQQALVQDAHMSSGFAALLNGNVKVSSITTSGIWIPPTSPLQTGEVLQIPTFVLSKPCQQALLAGGGQPDGRLFIVV
jgi:hypothetical protein